jgi:hypothetical protein
LLSGIRFRKQLLASAHEPPLQEAVAGQARSP